jgi:hypothetical protein
MIHCISGYHAAAGITEMKVIKAPCGLPFLLAAGDDSLRLNSRCLTSEAVISTSLKARMATTLMWMQMTWKKHFKPMMDQRRMWRTEGIVLESVKIEQNISDV